MNWKNYCKDRGIGILIYIVMTVCILAFLGLFQVPGALTAAVAVILTGFGIILLWHGYFIRYSFYCEIEKYLFELDKKYLITEIINRPSFLEGQLFYDSLREIGKNMYDNVEKHEAGVREFKEYVELWVHEIKLPIASSFLIMHNNRNEVTRKLREQMQRIESDVEQVLYYVRSENVEKDYLIKRCSLQEIIARVIQRNKDAILCRKVSICLPDDDCEIFTDSKWLEFIINQIVSNSLKYVEEQKGEISFSIRHIQEDSVLEICDNGMGIPNSELSRVFEKSYTGSNGRKVSAATGMGLYLCRELCTKLGHGIEIQSREGEFTCVRLSFRPESYYQAALR
ncbi:MAG: sensor histidine kinase [Eubacteriales bacterium]|nr:sensor histidine kinase [Eubacteriales bacterium]